MELWMSISVKRDHDMVVVSIGGQLVTANRHELKEVVLREIETGGRRFRVDFADTGYVDSSGLGVLVSISKRIRDASGSMQLANLNEDLVTLFALTKLDTLFDILGSSADQRPRSPRPEIRMRDLPEDGDRREDPPRV
jgi:anti-sigma B factor antagonist